MFSLCASCCFSGLIISCAGLFSVQRCICWLRSGVNVLEKSLEDCEIQDKINVPLSAAATHHFSWQLLNSEEWLSSGPGSNWMWRHLGGDHVLLEPRLRHVLRHPRRQDCVSCSLCSVWERSVKSAPAPRYLRLTFRQPSTCSEGNLWGVMHSVKLTYWCSGNHCCVYGSKTYNASKLMKAWWLHDPFYLGEKDSEMLLMDGWM